VDKVLEFQLQYQSFNEYSGCVSLQAWFFWMHEENSICLGMVEGTV